MLGSTSWRPVALAATLMISGCASIGPDAVARTGVPTDRPTFISRDSTAFRQQVINVVNFDFDSDIVDAQAQEHILAQADWIRDNPDVQFSVTGHTDLVGNIAYNQDLGMRRAQNVVAALIAAGVPADQLIAMVSFGEELPLIDTEDKERINRRAVTEVLGDEPTGSTSPNRPDPNRDRDRDDDPDDGPPDLPPPSTGCKDEASNDTDCGDSPSGPALNTVTYDL